MKLSALLICGIFTVLFTQADAATLKFTFNPADSLDYTGVTVTARASFVDSTQGPMDTIRTTSHLLFTREGSTFHVLSSPESIVVSRNGKIVNDPVTAVLAHTPITYTIDSTGQAVSVTGYGGVVGEVTAGMAQAPEDVKRALSEEMLNAGALTDWDARVGSLVGLPVTLGDISFTHDTQIMGNGARLAVYTVARVTDTFRVDGKLCARVYRYSDTDIARLAKTIDVTEEALQKEMKLSPEEAASPKDESARTWTSDEQVMEIGTMIILAEHRQTETLLSLAGQDQKMHAVRLIEVTSKEYSYGSDAAGDKQ
jgi:hypothetical protein